MSPFAPEIKAMVLAKLNASPADALAMREFLKRLPRLPPGMEVMPFSVPVVMAKPARRDADQKLDVKQAARKLGTTEDQVRGFVQDGELRYINVGRGKKRPRLRFTEADLDEFIERRMRKSEPICQSTNRKSHRFTGSTSKSGAVGFTAQRNAHLAKTPKITSP